MYLFGKTWDCRAHAPLVAHAEDVRLPICGYMYLFGKTWDCRAHTPLVAHAEDVRLPMMRYSLCSVRFDSVEEFKAFYILCCHFVRFRRVDYFWFNLLLTINYRSGQRVRLVLPLNILFKFL